jgi:hypothetical protein
MQDENPLLGFKPSYLTRVRVRFLVGAALVMIVVRRLKRLNDHLVNTTFSKLS